MTSRGLVLDTMVLVHFGRSGRLPVLEELVRGRPCFITGAVRDEVADWAAQHPALEGVADLPWLETVSIDQLAELRVFASLAAILDVGDRNVGEATVLAYAQVHDLIPVTDDGPARREAKRRHMEVHGTLWLVIEGYNRRLLSEAQAKELVQRLADAKAHFPCQPDELFEWAREKGMIS